MPRSEELANEDLWSLYAAARALGEVVRCDDLIEQVLSIMGQLIEGNAHHVVVSDGSVATYHTRISGGGLVRTAVEPAGANAGWLSVFDHPGTSEAVCWSDLPPETSRSFRGSDAWSAIYEPLDAAQAMATVLATGPSHTLGMEVVRRHREFDDRDRTLLALLAPLLGAAWVRATELTVLAESLEAMRRPVVAIDQAGVVRHMSDTAAAMLSRHLGRAPEPGDTLPPPLDDLLPTDMATTTVVETTHDDETHSSLAVRVVPSDTTDVLLLHETDPDRQRDVVMQGLRLSPRQADVLLLIGRGFTDRQIADELDIAVRTVRKHIDSIFRRLDVDNRTLAARVCRDIVYGRWDPTVRAGDG